MVASWMGCSVLQSTLTGCVVRQLLRLPGMPRCALTRPGPLCGAGAAKDNTEK